MNEGNSVAESITFGAVFIAIGVMGILDEMDIVSLSWLYVLPVVLIIAGVALIISTQVDRARDG